MKQEVSIKWYKEEEEGEWKISSNKVESNVEFPISSEIFQKLASVSSFSI